MQPRRLRDTETDAEKKKIEFLLRALRALRGNKNFYRKGREEREEIPNQLFSLTSLRPSLRLGVSAVAFALN
jgi:hypothetical protein